MVFAGNCGDDIVRPPCRSSSAAQSLREPAAMRRMENRERFMFVRGELGGHDLQARSAVAAGAEVLHCRAGQLVSCRRRIW